MLKKSPFLSVFFLFLTLAASSNAYAQAFKAKDVVKWTEKHAIPANAKVGDIVTMSFSSAVKEGFHIYASQQPSKAALPLEFILDKESKGIELLGKVIDGPGKKTEHDDIFDADISFYEKTATFSQKVKITAENPTIKGHLRYQVCDDNMCVPDNYEFATPVKTVGSAKTTDANPTSTTKTADEAVKKNADEIAARKADSLKKVQEAQTSDPAGDVKILDGINWSVKVMPDGKQKLKTGDIVTLTFRALIDPGVKYLGSSPQKNGSIAQPSFDLDAIESKNLEEVGDLALKGNKKTGKDKITYYQDSVTLTQQLKVTADNPVLKGFLTYQASEGDKTATGKQEIPNFSWAQGEPNDTKIGTTPPPITEGCNLWALFLAGLGAGILAVLTPCFYPMIPLTVTYFTKQSGTRAKGIFNAILYGTSIVFMFTVVTLLLAAIAGPQVLHQIATSPWVNILLFLIIFAFGLSFLGLFDLSLPSSVVNAISQKGNTTSVIGIFFMAMTLVLVSFSCTGAFVAPLLKAAAEGGGSFLCIVVPMIGFSSALALPFTLLALFPSLLQSMPRSGSWLGTFKATLGFLEIALAFMYLSNADLVLHWGLLPRPIFLGIWIAIAFVLGYYLLGRVHIKNNDVVTEGITVPRLLFAILFIALGFYMLPGLLNKPLPLLDGAALLPPPDANSAENAGASAKSASANEICNFPGKKYDYLSSETPPGLCAFYDLEQGLEYAKKVNKPVLLDFTGHTCKNCRKVEQTIWTDPEITKMLQEDYVLVSLFTDDFKNLEGDAVEVSPTGMKIYTVGDKWRDYEDRMYGFIAQPYYVLLDHDKSSLTTPWDYAAAPNVAMYKKNLQTGLAEFKRKHGM